MSLTLPPGMTLGETKAGGVLADSDWDDVPVRTITNQLQLTREVRTPQGEAFFHKPIGTVLGEGAYSAQLAEDHSHTSLAKHTDANGKLTPERNALHEKLISDEFAEHTPVTHPVATFLGGGPAAGKTTVMRTVEPNTVHSAADDLQEKFPDYQVKKAAGDTRAAVWAHDEASKLADKVMKRAINAKHNFVLDGTGNSTYEKLASKVKQARDAGYLTSAKYVTIPTDEAVRRSLSRAKESVRLVPETVLRAKHASVSDTFKKALDNELFDSAELWDNTETTPKLVGSKPIGGTWQVHDPDAWQRFLAKRNETV
jgi:predicted ABC-type ATPase